MKVLLSIKPEFVEKILSGEKLFEYRKAIFKRSDVKSVVIYSTMPEGKIVGEFSIGKILKEKPDVIWNKTKDFSGIDRGFYDDYFNDRDIAYAIQIKDLIIYKTPINPYTSVVNFTAPQSFKYVTENMY